MRDNNLKQRTKLFAIRIVKVVRALPNNLEGRNIGNQLFRCGTSVAANYRAACRARSISDFIAKIGIVVEETDETAFWLELITDLGLLKERQIKDLLKESNEILAIMITSINSAKKNKKN